MIGIRVESVQKHELNPFHPCVECMYFLVLHFPLLATGSSYMKETFLWHCVLLRQIHGGNIYILLNKYYSTNELLFFKSN